MLKLDAEKAAKIGYVLFRYMRARIASRTTWLNGHFRLMSWPS